MQAHGGATANPDLSFGRWVRRRRKALDLTQAELAQRVGYAAVTIHKVETDQLRPSRQMGQRLADGLAIAPAEREAFIRFARNDSHVEPLVLLPPIPEGPAVSPRHRRSNLPIAATRFFGREEELRVACTLLVGNARLLTLTGAGGIGKTRLGLEVATALVDTFPDGVWFLDLAPLADPELLLPAVATVLRVSADPSQPLQTALVGALHDRHLLLMLDNCEHLADACARLIAHILRSTPNIRILTTSRVALRVPGEVNRPVDPLPLPPQRSSLKLDQLQQYAVVRLFADRALAVQPRFAVTDANASALVQICQRLDGIPLALELAAARVSALSIEQITTRLEDRFRLLTGGSRTALSRHQTLRATLDWSYDLLSKRERRVFERLAVFAGGWTLEAAEAVAAANEIQPAEVLDNLTALIDQSLVTVEDTAGQRRYRLLETLRQYGWERLLETGTAADAQGRHFEWYLGLAEQSDPELPGTQYQPGLTQLAEEHDNLRVALAWSLDDDPERALRLAGCLAEFWRRGGHHAEGRRLLSTVLAVADSSSAPIEARARVLLGAGQLAADAGEFGPDQVARAEDSVQLFRDAGNERALVDALQHLGRCVLESGGPVERVQQVFDESLLVARTRGDEHGIGFALANLAHLAWRQGKHPEAVQRCEEAVRHIRASGDAMFTGLVLALLGWYAMIDGDLEVARRHKEESLALLRSLDAKEAVGLALLGLAHVARQAGDDAWMRSLLEESASLLHKTGSPGLADWLTFAGRIQVERGEYLGGVRTLAASESEGPRFGSLRFLLYQTSRDAADASLATARSALGEAAFQAAWIEGKATPPHRAVATALAKFEKDGAK